MLQNPWSDAALGIRATKSAPCSPIKPLAAQPRSDPFHAPLKVPVGDTPYVRAKRMQLVDKDPDKAIALFWSAINAGDRVDSALKDMAIVMKQQNRAEEAIEAIKSLRHRCSDLAQESLDNILLDLYKKCGRLEDQITLLQHKLRLIQQGMAFNGKRTKTARSQGRKFQVSLEEEATRLLGNLGWALMQRESYKEAELAYRRALMIGPDSNKMCNLGICLLKQGRVAEAKETLKKVRPAAMAEGPRGVESHLKAFERAQEMLRELEKNTPSIYGDENVDINRVAAGKKPLSKPLSAAPLPFYPKQIFQDPMGNLKRTRSDGATAAELWPRGMQMLPDEDAFDEAIVAAVLAPVLEAAAAAAEENNECGGGGGSCPATPTPLLAVRKVGKRLRVFEDITTQCVSPKA